MKLKRIENLRLELCTSLNWGVCLYSFLFFFWMGVTPTLEMSLLELWPAESSGTGLRGAARDSFNTLASALEEAVLLRDMDLEQGKRYFKKKNLLHKSITIINNIDCLLLMT